MKYHETKHIFQLPDFNKRKIKQLVLVVNARSIEVFRAREDSLPRSLEERQQLSLKISGLESR